MKLLKRSLLAIPAGLCMLHSAYADQVINDDLIVTFSQCVGNDCVNGESFGFDTLRLKENNLRINFNDTSNSASFPTNDWRIVANDSSNGGDNYLAFEDSTAGRIPFRVEAAAPANALVVEADGDIGIKTMNPVVDIHIVEGNTPTVRLEQDGSDGFTPQTWDVAGNEANFFIRDVTNGSSLFFRSEPGAPTNSIYIDSTGDIGIGKANPTERLEIVDSGNVRFALTASDGDQDTWVFNHNAGQDAFIFNYIDGGVVSEFVLSQTGDLTIAGSLTTSGTTCGSGGCDAVFAPETEIESIEEHAQQMWENRYLPSVGQTIENEPFNITQKTGGMLNELEKAHIYIEQLHKRLAALEAKMEDEKGE
jgi:hypothetical protein